MYPSPTTLQNLNLENLNSEIVWTTDLAQTFAPGVLRFEKNLNSTATFDYNESNTLNTSPPYTKGTALPKHPADTTLVQEPFQRFGDIVIIDYQDIKSAKGVDLLHQQIRSIKVRILRELNQQFYIGNGLGANLKGIINRFSFVISGGPFTLPILQEIRYGSKAASNEGLGWGGNAWLSHPSSMMELLQILGTELSTLEWKFHPIMKVWVPIFLGIPWFVDENVPTIVVLPGHFITNLLVVNLNHLKILYSANENYPTDSRGIQVIPIPMQKNTSEMGFLVTGNYAIQNDPGNISWLRAFSIIL